jgi:hypothetical protein
MSTLNEIIARLEQEDPTLVLPIGWHNPHSYRGYYECVAFEPKPNTSVGDCLAAARKALGSTYSGWKGGDYRMDEWTDCYLAERGDCGDELNMLVLDLDIAAAKQAAR